VFVSGRAFAVRLHEPGTLRPRLRVRTGSEWPARVRMGLIPSIIGRVAIGPGSQVGSFTVEELLGRGSSGVVYRGSHHILGYEVAIKVLEGLEVDPDQMTRFLREAQAISRLRHPNIVRLFDYGEIDGTQYMVVEYIGGGTLHGRLTFGQPMEIPTALSLLDSIAAGLDHAHSSGVVHRDVKPANILLQSEAIGVLADFGLAKLLEGSRTASGVIAGTPAYIAPEQVAGGAVGPAADRYALSTVAYELLTGQIPFHGLGPMELLHAQVQKEPPAPSSVSTGLSSQIDSILLRGLSKVPEQRWDSCRDMVDALRGAFIDTSQVSSSLPAVSTTRESTLARAATSGASEVTQVSGHGPPSRFPNTLQERTVWRHSRPVYIAVALIAALLVASLTFGFLELRNRSGAQAAIACVNLASSKPVTFDSPAQSCQVPAGAQLASLDCTKATTLPADWQFGALDTNGQPSDGATTAIASGRCVTEFTKPGTSIWIEPPIVHLETVAVADVLVPSGASGYFALLTRCGPDPCVSAGINTAGAFSVAERLDHVQGYKTLKAGDSLANRDVPVRFVVIAHGQNLRVWLNGQMLAAVPISVATPGTIQFDVGTYGTALPTISILHLYFMESR